MSACTDFSLNLRPISRLTSKTVFSGLIVAWFFAASPMRRSPLLSHATYDGVIRLPCEDARETAEGARRRHASRPFSTEPGREGVQEMCPATGLMGKSGGPGREGTQETFAVVGCVAFRPSRAGNASKICARRPGWWVNRPARPAKHIE